MSLLRIESYTKDIAAAATPENIVKDGSGNTVRAKEVHIECPSGNTSDLLLGDANGQFVTIPKGTVYKLTAINNRMSISEDYDLTSIWVKAGTNGDDVNVVLVIF